MAIALVSGQHATSTGQNGAMPSLTNTTGANLLLLAVGYYSGITSDPTTFQDSNSNTYDSLTKRTTGTPTTVRISHSNQTTPVVVAGHNFTWQGTNTFVAAGFSAWSGANAGASVLDTQTGTTVASTNVITLPSVTPSEDNCLVVTALMFEDNTSGAVSINGGFTILDTVAWSGATNEGLSIAYLIQTTAQAVSPTWNVTNSSLAMAATMAVFKGPGGGGGPAAILLGQECL